MIMALQLDWSLDYPVQDEVLPDDALVIKSRGTSGAGQFELAGYTSLFSGEELRARDVVNSKISFVLPSPCGNGYIRIGDEYPVREVGGKVRIAVKDEIESRPNIGNLFSALFFLPGVSSREKCQPFSNSDLGEKTYWIDDVCCSVYSIEDDLVLLEPTQFIFATSNKDDDTQFSKMARFDFASRLTLLYAICEKGLLEENGVLRTTFSYYRDVLKGKDVFDSSMGMFMRDYVMNWLAQHDASYTSSEDAVPVLSSRFSANVIMAEAAPPINEPHNLIFFGAPGTGKSYELSRLAEESFAAERTSRVTFYPDYTYSQFVGCFKPYSERDDKTGEDVVGYRFVPGPFLETYLAAIAHPEQLYLLIIEEINRANPAAVFGDVFQLLDRDASGNSVYSVATSEELAKCISDRLGELSEEERSAIDHHYDELGIKDFCEMSSRNLSLPFNMYIWATMNSADQGVFPMDTAFKRRWDFCYMGINEGVDADIGGTPLSEIEVPCGAYTVKWNELRMAINDFLLSDKINVNEDKLLGPFFVAPSSLTSGKRFTQVFKDKVLLYLFEDVGKTKRTKLFNNELKTYSQLCDAFEKDGVKIFGDGFVAPGFLETEEADVSNQNDMQE